MKYIPGVDMSTGSLGQGISAACGMALSGKLSDETYKVYAVLGDDQRDRLFIGIGEYFTLVKPALNIVRLCFFCCSFN